MKLNHKDNALDKGNENRDYGTHPVKEMQANELGIYDMSSNVWEWCQDWFDKNFYDSSSKSNPCNNTEASYRVYRGGSWFSNDQLCRISVRSGYTTEIQRNNLGFRLAR